MLKPRARDELLAYLFDGGIITGQAEVARWIEAQPRFGDFLQTNRDKVRKKLRTALTEDAAHGTRTELLVAWLLLGDRRCEIEYEAYGSGKGGPDMTVTFRANQRFNVEVTHLSTLATQPDPAGRLGTVLLAKLRQLPPAMPNLLVIALGGGAALNPQEGLTPTPGVPEKMSPPLQALEAKESHVAAAVRQLKAHAERKDDPFFTRHRYENTRDFYARLLRLSAVALLAETPSEPAQPSGTLWLNREARHPLPKEATTALVRCLISSE